MTRTVTASSPPEVFVMNADRSNPRRVGSGFSPTWSQDGRRLAFVSNGANYSRYLAVVGADGSGLRRLFRIACDFFERPSGRRTAS